MERLYWMTFTFVDGTSLTLSFPARADGDSHDHLRQMREFLKIDPLVFEVEGQLMMIPLHNVKYLQAGPAPEVLPKEVIRGAIVRS